MKGALAAVLIASGAGVACAQDEALPSGRRADRPEKPGWEFAATVFGNIPREGERYATGVFVANRGALHLEARLNYESRHAQSAFAGWTFSGGEQVKVEFTPILGGVTGDVKGPVAGFEASVAAGRFDYYVEAEYVRDRTAGASSYAYAWSELAYRPADWLRGGLVVQRTRVYGGERDVQRGPFFQVTKGPLTLGAYWFNPGNDKQVAVVSVGVTY